MHSNVLDSRSIGLGDAFGQRFMKEGTYRYHVVRPGGGRMTNEYPYEIAVAPADRGREMHQETVMVGADDSTPRPDRARVEIEAGDLVIWAPADGAVPRFEVVGERDFFGSATLKNECGYSHAFGLAGEFAWRDANGGSTRGVVRVKDPKVDTTAGLERWKKRLATAQLVMINDGSAEPEEVEIEVGQTVYFAVVNGDGITVTDDQLLRAGGKDVGQYDTYDGDDRPEKKKPAATKRTGAKASAKRRATKR